MRLVRLIKLIFIIAFIVILTIYLKKENQNPSEAKTSHENEKIIQNIHNNEEKNMKFHLLGEKAEFIVKMMKHAWDGYAKTAFGQNENRPVSGNSLPGVLGSDFKGTVIIDSIDTLYIMGLMDEYYQARNWIRDHFTCDVPNYISFFEFNIRIIGGLLSAYALTNEKIFLDKVTDCAKRLYTAGFSDSTLYPYSKVDLSAGIGVNDGISLAQVGTLSLEFTYLSYLLKDRKFYDKAVQIRDSIESKFGSKPPYYCYGSVESSVAEECDSFYEYLLKNYIQIGKPAQKSLDMFLESSEAIYKELSVKKDQNIYLVKRNGDQINNQMSSLACFAGGMYFQGSRYTSSFYQIGEGITSACHHSYQSSETKLGPEKFDTDGKASNKQYMLRPEVVESYFLGYRTGLNDKYRNWAWEAALAIEKHCKVKYGYSGIVDVNSIPVQYDDHQQSFFLAETLKYLYLIFSDKIDLDKWVFNTEGHPFPIIKDFPY